jgi:hypothetical protein
MLGHASASMTLDVYADLFDDDLTAVAEELAALWAECGQNRLPRVASKPDIASTRPNGVIAVEPPVRIELIARPWPGPRRWT